MLSRIKLFFITFHKLLFTKEVVAYKDRFKFWQVFFYSSAVFGALLLVMGEIVNGGVFFVLSFWFFLKSFRYEMGKNKRSELTQAIQNRDVDYIKHILEKGSDANELDGFGNQPTTYAEKYGGRAKEEIVELLKQYGAKKD